MVVSPSTTTRDQFASSADRYPAPIVQNGPTSTSGASFCIGMNYREREHARKPLQPPAEQPSAMPGGELAFNQRRSASKLANVAYDNGQDLRFQHQLIAGNHHALESRVIDTRQIHDLLTIVCRAGGTDLNASTPAACAIASNDEHPGITGFPGKVT